MLKNVIFVNQAAAESNVGLPNWAVISITDSDNARIKQGWHSVLRSQFSDVDMQFSDQELEKAITEEQALEIVDYVHAVEPHVEGILVHCKGGVSRSAAVAKWIAKTFGLPFNHQYALFNTHVYDQLIHATARSDRKPKP